MSTRSILEATLMVALGVTGLVITASACNGTVDTTSDASTDAGFIVPETSVDASATDASPPVDAPTDTAPGDAAPTDSGDASTCVQAPKVGDPCVSGQKSCEKIDGCCLPQVVCDATKGTWELLYLRCPCQSVTCGSSTCPGTQFCRSRASGVDGGGTSYECANYPPACERQWTCACLQANSAAICSQPPASCRDQGGRPFQACAGQ